MNTTSNHDLETTPEDDRHTVATYLSDMLALERHIARPIDAQLASKDHGSIGEARQLISEIKTCTDRHIASLEARLSDVGGDGISPVKSAWSALLGGGAAAINQVRKTKVSKSLRDDYTALALSTISYTMLHATASGLGDSATAQLAKRHLDDYAPIVVAISKAMPKVVLRELQDDGENVDISAAAASEERTAESWSGSNVGSSVTR